MNMITLAKTTLPVWSYILIFVAFFGLIVAIVIIVKKFVKPLQIKNQKQMKKILSKKNLIEF